MRETCIEDEGRWKGAFGSWAEGVVGKKVTLFFPCVLGTKPVFGQEANSPGVFNTSQHWELF